MNKYLLTVLLLTAAVKGHAQSTIIPAAQPHTVLAQFFSALNSQQFANAYKLCEGKRWGTLAYFSSLAAYGGISAVEVLSIEEKQDYDSETTLTAHTAVTDKTNGSGTFIQAFTLKKQAKNIWKITNIKLLESSRPQDKWNLKMPAQADFTMADVKRLAKPVYDTVKNKTYTESPDDTMVRKFSNLNFIQTDKGLFAIAIVENQGPRYGIYTGWCDAFAFKKESNGWRLMSVLLQAGGGGRMGYPGRYERMMRVGDFAAGIVISSYMGHMGVEISTESIVALKEGILAPLTIVSTEFTKDNSFGTPPVNIGNLYYFERKDQADYDLIIKQYDYIGNNPRKLKSIRIPYKNGYPIPDNYSFAN